LIPRLDDLQGEPRHAENKKTKKLAKKPKNCKNLDKAKDKALEEGNHENTRSA
jgi:hypothetical protein